MCERKTTMNKIIPNKLKIGDEIRVIAPYWIILIII